MLLALNLVARASLKCHGRMLGQATSSLAAPEILSQHITPPLGSGAANSAANRHPAGVQEDNSGHPPPL